MIDEPFGDMIATLHRHAPSQRRSPRRRQLFLVGFAHEWQEMVRGAITDERAVQGNETDFASHAPHSTVPSEAARLLSGPSGKTMLNHCHVRILE